MFLLVRIPLHQSVYEPWLTNPGYKLSMVKFANGLPTEPSTSQKGAIDIMSNADVTTCYDSDCFRPVGLAWDSKGRLFMSSDTTGEIYAIVRKDGTPVNKVGSKGTSTGTPTSTGTGSASSSTPTGVASARSMSALAVLFGILAFVL